MALGDARTILRIPGRLVSGPTDATIAFPHGGTALGITSRMVIRPMLVRRAITAEEFGGEVVDVIEGSQSVIFGALVRGFDNDMISTLFKTTTVGANTGQRIVEYPKTDRAGTLGSDRAIKLLFSPDDTEKHQAFLMYSAIPLLEEAAELALSINVETTFPAVFHGIRDASGRVYQFGRLEDLTVT